jgi:hypothetical protein
VRSNPALFYFKNGEIISTQNRVLSKSEMNSHLTSKKIKIMKKLALVSIALLFANQIFAQLPDPGFEVCKTAIVITDPQNDFSPDGATWGRRRV